MISPEATAPARARFIWPWLLGGLAALVVIGALVVWGLNQPIHVTVDGQRLALPARTTVLDLRDGGLLNVRRGALLSVKGEVLQASGGAYGQVIRNGSPTSEDQRLFEGDTVEGRRGADVTEERVTEREYMPIEVIDEGVGPVATLKHLGAPGIVEVTKGKLSGTVLARSVVATADEMIVGHRPATSTDRLVALTFDDGPWPGQTEKILAVLKKQNVHATFFMLGIQARRSPDLARRVAAAGHLVGSHSLSHKELTKLKPPAIRKEIADGIRVVGAATGTRPVWFRPPYGAINKTVRKEARGLKVKIALWDIDTLDWTKPGTHMLYRNAVRSTKPGQIVLMHDGGQDRSQTIAALPEIIEDLRSKGFNFVTLDELAAAK